jgi:diadenosine tetraphosphate (Ap4A) HIT family hydrolase
VDLMPETLIDEGEHWTIALNRNQDLLGKVMLVLRRPCAAVIAIEADEWMSLHHEVRRVVPALELLFAPDQLNFAFLMNLDAQVHLHVVPRYAAPRRWREHEFVDAHWGSAFGHEQRLLDIAELQALASEIRGALARLG